MTISRRDTILMTVLINLGVVAILLVTAITDQEEDLIQASTTPLSREMNPISVVPQKEEKLVVKQENIKPFDEVDKVIAAFTAEKPAQEIVLTPQAEAASPYVSVTVKRGDALDKIARANGTTVDEIKRINKLSTDRLKVGQVLQIPISGQPLTEVASLPDDGGVYATVEKGDNPWKIARRFNVSYTQILRLNDLDEASARNLKVGDKIRVK